MRGLVEDLREVASCGGFQYPILFLPCRDLQIVQSFYNGTLGLPIALDQGECVIFRVGGSGVAKGYLGFCAGLGPELADPERVCLTLVVSTRREVDQWHRRLTELDVACISPPAYKPKFHIYNAFFRDPSGYTLEIQAFDDEYAPE